MTTPLTKALTSAILSSSSICVDGTNLDLPFTIPSRQENKSTDDCASVKGHDT